MNRFQAALKRQNTKTPPVWFMRQAGRYHAHYQELRRKHSFVDLCKRPEVACEATLGPIRDFDFDAAILFSDLLFPLEAMGMGLRYDEGPKLDWHLREPKDLERLQGGETLAAKLQFQGEAMRLIREKLPSEKGLLGFVGGPLTLFCYAAEGSHSGELASARLGLADGRYSGFVEKLLGLLAEDMAIQARAGADVIAVLDTCAGEFSPETFASDVVPSILALLERFKSKCPDKAVLYYSKGTGPSHWRALRGLPIDGLGIDWRYPVSDALQEFGSQWAIQGNVDPGWLFLDSKELEARLRDFFWQVRALPEEIRGSWICGLGHGVLPKTPEENVKLFIRLQREIFGGQAL